MPAYVLGVVPLRPGFERFEVHPRPGDLKWAKGRIPTPLGTIEVALKNDGRRFTIELPAPGGTVAQVRPPEDGRKKWRLVKGDGKAMRVDQKTILGEGVHRVVFMSKTS